MVAEEGSPRLSYNIDFKYNVGSMGESTTPKNTLTLAILDESPISSDKVMPQFPNPHSSPIKTSLSCLAHHRRLADDVRTTSRPPASDRLQPVLTYPHRQANNRLCLKPTPAFVKTRELIPYERTALVDCCRKPNRRFLGLISRS